MSHGYHSLDNPQTIWHDGCAECDRRAAALPTSLGELDDRRRVQAWRYMRAWSWTGGRWNAQTPSMNDRALFASLYTIGVFVERAGIGPARFEAMLVAEHDRLVDGLRGTLELRKLTPALEGIDLTGIHAAADGRRP